MKKSLFRGIFATAGLFFCLCFFCMASPVWAKDPAFSPAFKTIGYWDKNTNARVDVSVWYPTHSKPSTANYGPWRLQVVRYGNAVEGRFPLIVLSHDSAASRFSYHESAALLAAMGFVVMAPEHKGDNLQSLEHAFQWQLLAQRMQEVRTVLHMAESHDDVRHMIDTSRMGFLGFGAGATIGLILSGAMVDAAGWENYCVQVPQSTTYCNVWAQERVKKMLGTLPPFGQSFADARLKAVVAVSPKYDFLLTPRALQVITRPLLLVETEKDLNKKVWLASTFFETFPEQTEFSLINGIEIRDLMAACPPALRKDLPDLCGKANPEERELAHESMHESIIPFLLQVLGQSAP